MFEQLTFANEKEKQDFEKYFPLKGEYLHNQVYAILLEKNKETVSYQELSSFIRYDKNLRNTLYIYLATCEEYLKAKFLKCFDSKKKAPKFVCQRNKKTFIENLFPINNAKSSTLFYGFNIDFQVLLEICADYKLIYFDKTQIDNMNTLRNHTMHHAMLLFGQAHDLKEAYDNFDALEKQLNALLSLLPSEYQKGFISSIEALNGKGDNKYLKEFYLEYQDDKLHIKGNH